MSFLNPSYLFALAAVAIPILVHIFSRRKVPQLPWSSIRFLKPAERRSMVRIEMRRLVLLLLRIAGIVLLALAFARPVVRGSLASLFPAGGSRAVCILLDRSFSMGLEGEEGRAIDLAKARISEIAASLEQDDRVVLVLFDSRQEVIYDGKPDLPAIKAALADVAPSWRGTDLRAAIAFARELLVSTQRESRELILVSDFHRSGLGRSRGVANEPIRSLIVPIMEEEANVAISQVYAPKAALHRGETARLGISIRNADRRRPARFTLEVLASGERVMEKEVSVAADGISNETALVQAEPTGWIEGYARKSRDRLAADDERRFALHVMEKARVLLVSDVENIYLESALSPGASESDVELLKKDSKNLTSRDISEADAAVIGPGAKIGARDIELFLRFVERDGTLVVFVLPELEGVVRRLSRHKIELEFAEAGDGFLRIASPREVPVLLAPFGEEDLMALARIRFSSAAIVRGVPKEEIVLNFATGAPFIWMEKHGQGAMFFVCVNPVPESGELVLSPFFLPLVQCLALHSTRRFEVEEGVIVGQAISLPYPARGDIEVEYPDGSIWRPVSSGSDPSGLSLQIPPAEEPGFLRLRAGGETLSVIAVNPDCSRESDLSRLSGQEAADSLGLQYRAVLGSGDEAKAVLLESRMGKEITTSLLVAAAAVLALELLVAQRKVREGTGSVG